MSQETYTNVSKEIEEMSESSANNDEATANIVEVTQDMPTKRRRSQPEKRTKNPYNTSPKVETQQKSEY